MGVTGKDADEALERSAITCNKNGVPGDPLPPTKTSGIRVGSPAGTTRGFGIAEFQQIGDMIADVLDALREKGEAGDPKVEADVRQIGRAHVCTPVTHAHLVCRLLLENKQLTTNNTIHTQATHTAPRMRT